MPLRILFVYKTFTTCKINQLIVDVGNSCIGCTINGANMTLMLYDKIAEFTVIPILASKLMISINFTI